MKLFLMVLGGIAVYFVMIALILAIFIGGNPRRGRR